MADVISLLTLPSSNAFTSLQSSVLDASAPRKVARLDTDSDSGSAFRSRADARTAPTHHGPVPIRVAGDPAEPLTQQENDSPLALLHSTDPLPASYERIFQACHHVVLISGKADALVDIIKLELDRCGTALQRKLSRDHAVGLAYFVPFAETLTRFEERTKLLQALLTYLDRVHFDESTSLRKTTHELLALRIFDDRWLHTNFDGSVREWLAWEREHQEAHSIRPSIREVIRHLLAHSNYLSRFEVFYLRDVRAFYAEESRKRSQPGASPLEFLEFCQEKIQEETKRAGDVLPSSSWAAVEQAVESGLLGDNLEWLADGTVGQLVERHQYSQLVMLNRLFDRASGLKYLMAAYKSFLLDRVTLMVTDDSEEDTMVDKLLKFRASADRVIREAFVDEEGRPRKDFEYALIDAFATGFKARRNKPAEMIAKHVDRMMRKGQRGASDVEFQAQLDDALVLYRFTDDKDVFRTFYHRALAKRLLLARSASDDFEKAILKKLKEQYDPEFSMGDHMFNDLALSRDVMTEYNGRTADAGSALKFSAVILQQSFWPFSLRTADAYLPGWMQDDLAAFARFYKEKHQGHKLEWNHALGTAILKAKFARDHKELSVSLYQALVLLLFNAANRISFRDIAAQTQIEDAELRRALQSLACGNKKVLMKRPVGKDVKDGDVFSFNENFTDPRTKVHISAIQVKETPEESTRTLKAIEGDRVHYIDAAIVRIMKARKKLTYEQIKTETIAAVKNHFVPEVVSIKQRVDSLVEQEYLERDDDDRNLFLYVA
ncbi:Cullin-domain-containing protein [Auriscalpium vulgare]|uniref:Cullin-domain-containing protein n=1 Tax=Auriscalpium vulgare TaxID=40419 RepID=A0ACB8RDS1_9AGAM|nr:Cullin-domain-containing protein [Auriscalpium vulgare]